MNLSGMGTALAGGIAGAGQNYSPQNMLLKQQYQQNQQGMQDTQGGQALLIRSAQALGSPDALMKADPLTSLKMLAQTNPGAPQGQLMSAWATLEKGKQTAQKSQMNESAMGLKQAETDYYKARATDDPLRTKAYVDKSERQPTPRQPATGGGKPSVSQARQDANIRKAQEYIKKLSKQEIDDANAAIQPTGKQKEILKMLDQAGRATMDSGAAPAAAPAAPAPAADGAPDPSALSDTEEKSFDGGKTWWHLQDGKPVQAQ